MNGDQLIIALVFKLGGRMQMLLKQGPKRLAKTPRGLNKELKEG